MKLKIIGILIAFLFINGAIVVGQTNLKINQKNDTINLDDVPIWEIGDSWTFILHDFTYEYYGGGQGFYFSGEINDFTWTVANVEGDTYELDFTGNLNCDYEITVSSSLRTFVFTGIIEASRTTFSGSLVFTKSNLDFQEVTGEIKGITKVKIGNLPFSLPLPFKLTIGSDFSTDFPLFDFPLSTHKFWDLLLHSCCWLFFHSFISNTKSRLI